VTTALLDHAAISERIPHAGTMCLLNSVLGWSAETITCSITNHQDAAHPLRSATGLLASAAIEYASQAMALHGSLSANDGAAPVPGFLASVRGVTMQVARLDTQAGPLRVTATRLAGGAPQGQARSALYHFELHDRHGHRLLDGRAAVVLNSPLEPNAAPI
jgi:predicted hotdog family 3-hydroxylacyl-ACP dehydratase